MGLSSVQMGFVFSAFAWASSPFQIPGTVPVDKIAPRVLYPIVIGIWPLFTCLQGTATTVWQLVCYNVLG
ncbi:hypothetical protein D8L93_07515 [Sodalis-like symbiont of Bactericera trigonica]|nr:hypothetical protein D8L93_07515 [Sodalis-like symbiont of Bactericera trigonica]